MIHFYFFYKSLICLQLLRMSESSEVTLGVVMEDCWRSICRGISCDAESFSACLLDRLGAALAWAGAALTGGPPPPRLNSPSLSERLCMSESVGVSCSPRMFTMSLSLTLGGWNPAWAMGLLPAMLRLARPLES